MILVTHSADETKNFGKQLAAQLKGGDVVCLYGELGAGKTTLVKGIAEGFGITEEITSPTFTLMNVYQIKNSRFKACPEPSRGIQNLIHIDTYRLKNEKDLIDIGAADYVGQSETITIIEWPEKISKLLDAKKVINITLNHLKGNQRRVTMAD